MPLLYLRRLSGVERTAASNRQLAVVLAFVAGATNAGGYLAVRQYTSHMSGIVSSMADNTVLGKSELVFAGLGAVVSFLVGASCSAILINWGRRQRLRSQYAFPLLLEAGLLLCFGLVGGTLARERGLFVPMTVMLLCFIMGLQNAIITKVSRAEIRTTHVTGIITDLGIELGKLVYWNRAPADEAGAAVRADREKLRLLAALLAMFFVGGVCGALGFARGGFGTTIPLAVLLLVLAAVPVLDDVRAWVDRLFVPR